MGICIRPAQAFDLKEVLAINQAHLPAVSTLNVADLEELASWSEHFKVAVDETNKILGFILCLGPKRPYLSLNYTWFAQRYSQFLYIDRIVVCETAQRRGLGKQFYADALQAAQIIGAPLLCEVNIVPRNEESLAFHARLGFRSVGTQVTEGGKKRVTLLRLDPFQSSDAASALDSAST